MSLIPKAGAWIMIKRPIPVDIPIDPMSFYYALPTDKLFWAAELEGYWIPEWDETISRMMHLTECRKFDDFKELMYDCLRSPNAHDRHSAHKLEEMQKGIDAGLVGEDDLQQQVRIVTPFGQVSIQPHEYTIVKDMGEYVEASKDGHAFTLDK